MVKIAKNFDHSRTALLSLPILLFLLVLGSGESLPQPKQQQEAAPEIRLDDITFRIREIESTPSPLKLIEVHVAVFNRSQRITAPPNSMRLAVAPKEINFQGTPPKDGSDLQAEFTTLNVPLAPRTGRTLIIAFSLPKEGIESITFEIQINPPEGEKKTVTWRAE